jgi:hypothetical protein
LGRTSGVALALARPLADRQRFEQWTFPRHVEQLDQLGFGHRPMDATAIRLDVRHGNGVERIAGEPVVRDTPVAEVDQRPPVGVPRLRGHTLTRSGGEPAFHGIAA